MIAAVSEHKTKRQDSHSQIRISDPLAFVHVLIASELSKGPVSWSLAKGPRERRYPNTRPGAKASPAKSKEVSPSLLRHVPIASRAIKGSASSSFVEGPHEWQYPNTRKTKHEKASPV